MKILSFDVGIVNLAYCILDSDTYKIIKWEVISLQNQQDHAKLYVDLITNLDIRKEFLLDVHTVLIEKQPSFNPKMRIISGCIQTYFFIRGIVDVIDESKKIKVIKFYSPKHKLKCYTSSEPLKITESGSKYSKTKKLGILICEKKLIEYNEPIEIISIFKNSKKKDDLSDCYLQALTYILQFKKLLNINNTNNNFINTVIVLKPESIKSLKELIKQIIMDNNSDINKVINLLNESVDIQNKLITKFELKFPIDKDNLINLATKLQFKKLLKKN